MRENQNLDFTNTNLINRDYDETSKDATEKDYKRSNYLERVTRKCKDILAIHHTNYIEECESFVSSCTSKQQTIPCYGAG